MGQEPQTCSEQGHAGRWGIEPGPTLRGPVVDRRGVSAMTSSPPVARRDVMPNHRARR